MTRRIVDSLFVGVLVFISCMVVQYGRPTTPKFDTTGDNNVAIDRISGYPVLIIDREWYRSIGWEYTIVIPHQKPEYAIRGSREDDLRVPEWKPGARIALKEQLKDCRLNWTISSPDRTTHETHEIHIAEKGYWSFPIITNENGERSVTVQVEPAND